MKSRAAVGRRPEALLCDADGNLFASEEPAFDASVDVVNELLRSLGSDVRRTATELRRATTGQNFRCTARSLVQSLGRDIPDAELEQWVRREKETVTAHLAEVLEGDPTVKEALLHLSGSLELAVVTSSAAVRLDTCLTVTDLSGLFPADRRFSAEDSLAVPRSKPHPEIYQHALTQMDLCPEDALAVEDSVGGVRAARSAEIPVIGNIVFVAPCERSRRSRELLEAGAAAVVDSWGSVARLLGEVRELSAASPT